MASQQNSVKRKPNHAKEDTIPPKPKRPLTAFNLFSKLERNYIIQSSQKWSSMPTTSKSTITDSSNISEVKFDPYLEQRPEKYKDVILPPDWFKVSKLKNKRRFRETHGINLSKAISDRWNTLDDETKQYCEMIYAAQLEEYRKETEEYAHTYGEEAMTAQKRTYKKKKSTSKHKSNVTSNVHAAADWSSQLQDDGTHLSSADMTEEYAHTYNEEAMTAQKRTYKKKKSTSKHASNVHAAVDWSSQLQDDGTDLSSADIMNVPHLFTTNQNSETISRHNSSVPSDHDVSIPQLKHFPNNTVPFAGSANGISSHYSAYQFPSLQNSLTANSQMHPCITYQANHPSLQFSELDNRHGIEQEATFKQPTQHFLTANHHLESSVLAATTPRPYDKSDGNWQFLCGECQDQDGFGDLQPTLYDCQWTPGLELAQQGSRHYPAAQENLQPGEPVLTTQQLNSSNLEKIRKSFAFNQSSRDKLSSSP